MSVESTFAQLGENLESNDSVNPIVTPALSLHLPMADNTSTNGDNDPQLPNRGRLAIEVEDPERPRTLRERLAPERTAAPSCIRIPPHVGTFHFRNGMISLLSQFYSIENENAYLYLREFDEVCETFSDQTCPKEITKLKLFQIGRAHV